MKSATAVPLEDQEGIDDPVRMYLREIGKVFLLSAADEKHLARQMEEGQHIEAIEHTWREVHEAEPTAVEVALTLFEQLSAALAGAAGRRKAPQPPERHRAGGAPGRPVPAQPDRRRDGPRVRRVRRQGAERRARGRHALDRAALDRHAHPQA